MMLTPPRVFFFLRHWLTTALVLAACTGGSSAMAVECHVVAPHTPSEAESAFLRSDYDRAVALYQAQLQERPNDPALTAGLAQVFLRQQKANAALDVVQKAIASNPKSAILLTALGQVQYREGTPWLAAVSAEAASKLDPCYPPVHLLNARIFRLNSFYASAAKEIATAHSLDPHDPRIRRSWLQTLPLKERVAELEAYLSAENGEDPETLQSLHFYLDYLKQRATEPHQACRLVSTTETASIPFANMMRDATHIRAFGLDVKFNGHNARLQVDTGASGLVVSRSVANRAGLKEFSRMQVGGVGSEGRKPAYTAFAEDIKIGSLEFRDCEVDVIDKGNVVDSDGLIGMDVFSHFLITLDYPMRKLLLAPLPPRPDASTPVAPSLESQGNQEDDDAPSDAAGTQSTGSKPIPAGPHDRYVAPEMKDWTHIYRIGHNLLIPASLNNTEQKMFILDTGAFSTTVSPDVAREVTKVHGGDNMIVHGINGKVDKVYSADSILFRFANVSQRVENVVSFATSSVSKDLNMEVAGFIGFTALGQMTIHLDYRDGLVQFEYDPNRGYRALQ